ncbi:3'-5' exonuclease [Oerskovia jenensis]
MSGMPHVALPGLSFTAIDFETANEKRASVCSVGVVKVRDGAVVDVLETLVQPPPGHESFNYRNVGVHGIQAHHVVGAPAWDVVHTKVMEFAGGDPLVAHNASFDRSVMARASEVYGIRASPSQWLCTRDAAKSVLDLPSYRLPDVSAALSIPAHAHHDAGADARQCALVLVELCRRRGSTWRDLVRSHVRFA